MDILVRRYENHDIKDMTEIWNEVVIEANAFPQSEPMDLEEADVFFASQTYTGVAEVDGKIVGLFILHPNNVGRCGHISNASYAVKSTVRGMHIGRALVTDCLKQAKANGFRVLQFNAVVKSNETAIALYEKLGFVKLGRIPGGFRLRDGRYEDIYIFYYNLENVAE